jgi:DNA gyrase inhibitor GyrI
MVATSATEIRRLPSHTLAYQTHRGTIASIESVTSSVRSWVVTMGYRVEGPMAVEIAGEPTDDATQEYDMEIQLPVESRAKAHPSDHVQIKPFDETEAVVMTLNGPWELTHLSEPLSQMKQWMQDHNVQPRPVVRWVEVTDPTKVTTQEQVTELQYLVPRG